MATPKEPVYIIDGSSFLYRAYYSIRPLTAADGTPVNAVYGFCRMIRRMIDTYKPSHVALVWDSRGKTVRHEMYPAYKETRQATPNDLMGQKDLIQDFANTIGLKQLAVKDIEADDIMYSLARELEQAGHESVVVSSDKDLGQVLSARIRILDPFKEQFITKESLEEKLGFPLYKLPFYFALVGDSSDNIPGVAGIGPKGATKLVCQFESLTQLYENLEALSSERTRQLLHESKEAAFLSQELFTLKEYETGASKESLAFSEEAWQNAYPLFEKYGFRSLLKDVQLPSKPVTSLADIYTFILVDTPEKLKEVCQAIRTRKAFALDTEGTSLNPLLGETVGISVCVQEGTAYYIPFGHKTDEPQLSKDQVVTALKPLCEDPSIEKYLHHAKFDALMLSAIGITLNGISFDTLLAASLTLETGQKIGLKALSERFFDETMVSFKQVLKDHSCKDFSYVPLVAATTYAAADAHQTMKLVPLFKDLLVKKNVGQLYENLEHKVMQVLTSMEKIGIQLDSTVLEGINKVVSRDIAEVRGQITEFLPAEQADVNLNSPKQLGVLLFENLKLPVIKKTAGKTGYSTDQEVLEQLSQMHPIPGLIIRYRELTKLKSTYLDALGDYVNPLTGAIHTTYNQMAVATGRLASSDPNLQNIPVDRFAVRSAFKPREGAVFISADYSQIELRVLAYVSQDQVLLDAFKEGKDIHSLTAAGLFSVEPERVSSEQRQIGKRINFSILYGLTAHGLAKDLGVTHRVAQSYIDTFMAQYPGVVKWMESVVELTKEKGYVETVLGRRRYLPGIHERNRNLHDFAKRAAINTVGQGTAAELMKLGMVNLDAALKEASSDAHILLQIHDELLIEVPAEKSALVEELTKKVLESVVSWNVPLEVTTRIGGDWQRVTK